MDYRPKSEAFWLVGGFDRNIVERKKITSLKGVRAKKCMEKPDDPAER